ncbi:hypothetical protein BVC80_7393g2 [Macleaya cordata]|uniref:Transmembrane protein n=1 Tax=Macleaya cordata TaxID=56857 RepID=A0A200QB13_MACCD|nr:hypothetical protein BVC80_7393g2 [Macleaya cordata]
MEDLNLLAADGVVVCCCCPCLILQIVLFVLLKLPFKLVKKSKRLVHKRLHRKKKKKRDEKVKGIEKDEYIGDCKRIQGIPSNNYHDSRWVMVEVEEVLEEFSQQGEFAFGSFWGRGESRRKLPPDLDKVEFDDIVHYHLAQVIKSFHHS